MSAFRDTALERFVRSFSSAVTRVFPGVCAGSCLRMDRLREEFSELYGTTVRSVFAGTRIAGLFLARVLAHCASPELAKAAAAEAAPLAAERLLDAMNSEFSQTLEVFLWWVFGIYVFPRQQEAQGQRATTPASDSEGFVIRRKPRSKAPQPRSP